VSHSARQLRLGAALSLLAAAAVAPAAPPREEADSPSPSARRLFEGARSKLLQVRTLLRGQDSQATVGSGFVVAADGLAITNYHVVSQVARQPGRFRLVYDGTDGVQGPLELLAFDAVHDLALVRMVRPAGAPLPALPFRPASAALAKGERIYSLGNPLDVGFAVAEGIYNGLVERSFYPTIFFGGALNPGMSGGPVLDEQGRVVGINVATRFGGQLVSFLVPAAHAEELLARARSAAPITAPVYPELLRQLLAHQEHLTSRTTAQAWRLAGSSRYAIPVPPEAFMRCWGRNAPDDAKGMLFERSECTMDYQVFVSGQLRTGDIAVRHEEYDGERLGALRFLKQYSASFAREQLAAGDRQRTPPQCRERDLDRDGLPLRSVICLSAYRKLPGLYDLSVLVATLDQVRGGVQGRLDARGVSFDNALKLADFYLQGFGWKSDRR